MKIGKRPQTGRSWKDGGEIHIRIPETDAEGVEGAILASIRARSVFLVPFGEISDAAMLLFQWILDPSFSRKPPRGAIPSIFPRNPERRVFDYCTKLSWGVGYCGSGPNAIQERIAVSGIDGDFSLE